MQIKIVKNTVCGGVAVSQGDEVEASAEDARTLINLKKAVPVEAKNERATVALGSGALIETTMKQTPKRRRAKGRGKKNAK